jgi:2',3'-cyclic-nucleotide 2'-phosphodiesterase (5'-nucleotidase family)
VHNKTKVLARGCQIFPCVKKLAINFQNKTRVHTTRLLTSYYNSIITLLHPTNEVEKMKTTIRSLSTCVALALSIGSTIATAAETITLMQFSDLHGKMVPHQEIFEGDRAQNYSGGLTKMATAIKDVRDDDSEALLLMLGDTTHGSAETLFTMGESVMAGLNTLDIDVFTPGNWDFGHGPRAFRNRFAGGAPGGPAPAPPKGFTLPLPPNNRTTLDEVKAPSDCPGLPGNGPGSGRLTCNVTAATFDTVAINLYNYNEAAGVMGGRVLDPYKIVTTKGVDVAIIGITTDVVPQQAATFNIGFRFTMGFNELPGIITAAKEDGADVIVVQSELGLSKNLQLAKEIEGIDVMFSGHTHERTYDAIVVENNFNGKTIVTEAGEDTHLGVLELTVDGTGVIGHSWDLVEIDDAMSENVAMKNIVDSERAKFVGPGTTCHTFGPGGFAFGEGHTLCDDIQRRQLPVHHQRLPL